MEALDDPLVACRDPLAIVHTNIASLDQYRYKD
jgi:hypothetical protein